MSWRVILGASVVLLGACAGARTKTVVVHVAPVRSEARAAGLSWAEIRSATGDTKAHHVLRFLAGHEAELCACFVNGERRSTGGTVTFAWDIDARGAVSNVEIVDSTLADARAEGCMLRTMRYWRFSERASPARVDAFPVAFGVDSKRYAICPKEIDPEPERDPLELLGP